MFVRDRKRVSEGLQALLKMTCDYRGRIPCDCKYGLSEELLDPKTLTRIQPYSEQNGCPEIRCALQLIEAISDEEYNSIMKNKGHSSTDAFKPGGTIKMLTKDVCKDAGRRLRESFKNDENMWWESVDFLQFIEKHSEDVRMYIAMDLLKEGK